MSETTRSQAARRRAVPMVDVLVEGVPVVLRRALEQAANDGAASMNAVAVEALADEFSVPYVLPGRRSPGKRSSTDFLYLTMPRRLRQKLNEQRARTDVPVNQIIVSVLSRRFLT